MKILFLNTLGDPAVGGGAEVVIWEQMRGLQRAGHQCILLVTSSEPGIKKTEREGISVWSAGIRNVYWSGAERKSKPVITLVWHVIDSYIPTMQGYLRHVLDEERPDVVSIHNLPGWSSASWNTIKRFKIPSVQVLHDHYTICFKGSMFNRDGKNCQHRCTPCKLLRIPHRSMSNNVSAVVGVSRYIIDRHLQYGYFNQVPVTRVIHNARDPQSLGLVGCSPIKAHKAIRIGFIGRMERVKGIELLLDVFQKMNLPDVELWVAGSCDGAYGARLRAESNTEKVRFLGRMQPDKFYPQVDFIIVPSLWNENCSMVIIEALAFGKPVISSRLGGTPELIKDGENGILFDTKNPEELAAAIQSLATNTDLRARMSVAAADSAKPFINIDGWIEQYVNLYKVLVTVAH